MAKNSRTKNVQGKEPVADKLANNAPVRKTRESTGMSGRFRKQSVRFRSM